MGLRPKARRRPRAVDGAPPLGTRLQLYGIGRGGRHGRKALPASASALEEVLRARSLHSTESAHSCQVVARRGSMEHGLRRAAGREGHSTSRRRAVVCRGGGHILIVRLAVGSLHGGGGHRYGGDIVRDGRQALQVASSASLSFSLVSVNVASYLSWAAHREEARFLRHGLSAGRVHGRVCRCVARVQKCDNATRAAEWCGVPSFSVWARVNKGQGRSNRLCRDRRQHPSPLRSRDGRTPMPIQ